jgi:KUP system potassium uptake protein
VGADPARHLATAATVIASQALISGAFSLTMQAVHLGFCRACRSTTPPPTRSGRSTLRSVNWLLMIACVALVLGFRLRATWRRPTAWP